MLTLKQHLLKDIWEDLLKKANSIHVRIDDFNTYESIIKEYSYEEFINLTEEELIKIVFIELINADNETVSHRFFANDEWLPSNDIGIYIPYWIHEDKNKTNSDIPQW